MAACGETWAPRTDPLAQAAASHCQVHSLSHSDMCDRPIFFHQYCLSHLLSHIDSEYRHTNTFFNIPVSLYNFFHHTYSLSHPISLRMSL